MKRLENVNADLLRAIKGRDIVGCLTQNQTFHFTLYEAARSEVLLPLIEPLWLQAGPFMYFSLLSPDMPWDASAHSDVLQALARKDPAAARRAIERDIRNTATFLLKFAFNGTSGPLAVLRGEMRSVA